MSGNRRELAPGRLSPRCHVNTPLIIKDFNNFGSPFTTKFLFRLRRDSVSSTIQSPRSSSNLILRCASYFQLSSWCLDIPMKNCLPFLIRFYIDSFIAYTTFRFVKKAPTTIHGSPYIEFLFLAS